MKKFLSIFLLVILIVFVAGFLVFVLKQEILLEKFNIPFIASQQTQEKKEKVFFAVMIDNYSFGRIHHRGISKASILYEALAEGGITRIMAIFDKTIPERIGPTRSARLYFVKWADEYKPVYIHVGGSDEAMNLLYIDKNVFNVDGMAYEDIGDYFLRDKNIEKPHNDFVSLEAIKTLIPSGRPESENIFKFSDKKIDSQKRAEIITLDFSFPNYKVRFDYDKIFKKYFRSVGQKPHKDTLNDTQLFADNIIVQFMQYYPIDDVGRLKFSLDKGGDAFLIRDGLMSSGTWKKENGKTKFFDENGNEFRLKKGVTWVEVIDAKNRVRIESL